MTIQEFHPTHPVRIPPHRDPDIELELDALSVPYAGQTRMRLTITAGMADARVRIDPDATELIAIDCGEGTPPRLRVSAAELRVSWPTTIESWLRTLLVGEHRDLELVLHPAVEWTLQIRGGLARFDADLTSGKLERLEISGGVSDARLDLPPPAAVVPIRISGGVSDLALSRPADTGVTLMVRGGVSGLGLDDQSFDAIGGGARLVTGPVHGEVAHYAVEISGGASGLQVVPRRASLSAFGDARTHLPYQKKIFGRAT